LRDLKGESMDKDKVVTWARTAIIASVGGGFAAMFTAAMDPAKYTFPKDFGTGKLWPYFFQGAGLVFIGMVLKSPFGQHVVGAFKQSQEQMKESQADIAQTKAELRGAATPEAVQPEASTTTTVKPKSSK